MSHILMFCACHTVLALSKLIRSFSDPRFQAQMPKISALLTTAKTQKKIFIPQLKLISLEGKVIKKKVAKPYLAEKLRRALVKKKTLITRTGCEWFCHLKTLCIKEGLSEIWKEESSACLSENETLILTDDFLKHCS